MRITSKILGILSAVLITAVVLPAGAAAEGKTRVAKTLNFTDLAMGEVTTREIGAEKSENMKYGVDGVPLLSSRNGYENAYAIWKLDAAEGETLDDCVFTFVGHTFYQDAAQKENNSLKVSVSTDNENFTLVKEYKSNDNADTNQKFVHDLTEYAKGRSAVYVRMDFLVFDSPHIMGLSSLSIVGNAEGVGPTQEPTQEPTQAPTKAPVASETEATKAVTSTTGTVAPVDNSGNGLSAGAVVGIVAAAVVVLGGAGVAVFFILKKKKAEQE